QPGLLSDFILGSQDGLVNVLGVILGVAEASRDITIILAGGLAATFAESISMGAVAYTSTLARRDHYLAEVEREKEEMRTLPDLERQEVRDILERWDFHGAELDEMLEKIVSKPKAWLELMMAHELYLAPVDPTQARRSAVLVGIAAILGSLIPLIPFIVIGRDILLGTAVSLVVSTLALFAIGWSLHWLAKPIARVQIPPRALFPARDRFPRGSRGFSCPSTAIPGWPYQPSEHVTRQPRPKCSGQVHSRKGASQQAI